MVGGGPLDKLPFLMILFAVKLFLLLSNFVSGMCSALRESYIVFSKHTPLVIKPLTFENLKVIEFSQAYIPLIWTKSKVNSPCAVVVLLHMGLLVRPLLVHRVFLVLCH